MIDLANKKGVIKDILFIMLFPIKTHIWLVEIGCLGFGLNSGSLFGSGFLFAYETGHIIRFGLFVAFIVFNL